MWRIVENYTNYEVSDFGEVRVINSGRILKKSVDSRGYYKVTLTNKNSRKSFFVHRLVAIAFIENVYGYNQVNHIDENKQNNNVSNLEWCSIEYNCNYGTRNERISKANKNRVFSDEHIKKLSDSQSGSHNNMYGLTYDKSPHAKPVICVETKQIYLSCREASEKNDISKTSLCNCLKGYSKTAGGFHWKYI